jgi:putative SOS response-associated peptidase YedK
VQLRYANRDVSIRIQLRANLQPGEPNALCAPIHNRMPVLLDPADFPAWLGETAMAPEQLQALLRSYPPERMEAHMIGLRIGNVKNDDATLIERLKSA